MPATVIATVIATTLMHGARAIEVVINDNPATATSKSSNHSDSNSSGDCNERQRAAIIGKVVVPVTVVPMETLCPNCRPHKLVTTTATTAGTATLTATTPPADIMTAIVTPTMAVIVCRCLLPQAISN